MSFAEGRFEGVRIDQPICDCDEEFDQPANGQLHTIFNAWQHDPGFDGKRKVRSWVADGNKVIARKLTDEEWLLRKRGAGRPSGKKKKKLEKKLKKDKKKDSQYRPHMSQGQRRPSVVYRPSSASTPSSGGAKCPAVRTKEPTTKKEAPARRAEGLYGTVDMATGEILHLGEMLNAECLDYKLQAAAVVSSRAKVKTACLDTACAVRPHFEDAHCEGLLLDGWHAKRHKCSKKLNDYKHPNHAKRMKGLNSESAEQLWSRMDYLAHFVQHHSRAGLRMSLRRYGIWRTTFVRSKHTSDINPSRSRRRALKRRGIKTNMRTPMKRLRAIVAQTRAMKATDRKQAMKSMKRSV